MLSGNIITFNIFNSVKLIVLCFTVAFMSLLIRYLSRAGPSQIKTGFFCPFYIDVQIGTLHVLCSPLGLALTITPANRSYVDCSLTPLIWLLGWERFCFPIFLMLAF